VGAFWNTSGTYSGALLTGTFEAVGGTGVAMPMMGELTAEELDAVRVWIQQGASP
jgi:hypothetical protein